MIMRLGKTMDNNLLSQVHVFRQIFSTEIILAEKQIKKNNSMSKITEKWLQRSNLYCTQLVLWLLQESNCSTIDYRTKQGVLFVYDMKRKCGFTESCKKMVRLVALQTCSLTNISTH